MSNTLLTPSIIAKEAIMVLQNNLVFAGLVHRDYSEEFAQVGDTITVRKPATFTAEEWNGSSVTIQNASEGSVPVKMDKIIDVSFAVTSKELSLSVQSFSEQFIAPAMRAHAQKLDELLSGLYVDVPYSTAVGGTPAVSDLVAIGTAMNINKVPLGDRSLVVDPTTYGKYLPLDAVLHAEKSGSTQALRDASMGKVFGLGSYMDQNIKTHTKGTLAASSGALAIASADAGATQVVIAATACSGTLKKGDLITIADTAGVYVVTEDATAASNAITAKIYPALAAGVSGKAVTIKESHTANLAFHKNAFALVTRPLATPLGAARAETISFNGISCRVVYAYDKDKKQDTVSIDFLCGVKTLTPELAVRFLG